MCRRQVEDVKVSGRDSSANHALGVPAVSEVEAGELRCADGAEGADRLDAVDEVASRDVAPILAHVLVDRQQSIRIRKGKGPEDDRLHGAEDGRCGADAEREREHCDGREARASGKLPAGKLHVLSELREILRAAHVVIPLLSKRATSRVHPVDVPEPSYRGLARLRRRHASFDELARSHVDVEGQLRVDFVLDPGPPEPRAQPLPELHAGSSTLDTPAAKRAHCSVSAASWRRPLGVMR